MCSSSRCCFRPCGSCSPRDLDLAGFPAQPAPETAEVHRARRSLPARHLSLVLEACAVDCGTDVVRAVVEAPAQRALLALRRHRLRPGSLSCRLRPPRDERPVRHRHRGASSDCRSCCRATRIGPLSAAGLAADRESDRTHRARVVDLQYLRERGISAVLAADLAFLYPYAATGAPVATASVSVGVPALEQSGCGTRCGSTTARFSKARG